MVDWTTDTRIVLGSPRYTSLEVRIDQAKLDAWTARLRSVPGALARAVPPALNATAREMRTRLYQAFLLRMNIARKTSVKDRLEVDPEASAANWAAGVRVALTRFTVASFKGTRQLKSGVRWSPLAGAEKLIPRAFIRQGLTHYQTGKYMELRHAWRRAVRDGVMVPRKPIQLLRGPSLALVFTRDRGFQADAEQAGAGIVEKKIESQVDRIAGSFPR